MGAGGGKGGGGGSRSGRCCGRLPGELEEPKRSPAVPTVAPLPRATPGVRSGKAGGSVVRSSLRPVSSAGLARKAPGLVLPSATVVERGFFKLSIHAVSNCRTFCI